MRCLQILGVLLFCGCESVSPPAEVPAEEPSATAAVAPRFQVSGLSFAVPDDWVSEPTSSGMRAAQWRLPGSTEQSSVHVVLYYFGRSGAGDLTANLDRWIGQVQQPDGSDSRQVTAINTAEFGGCKVHCVDVAGTYVAETSPGSEVRLNQSDSRLLAAVVETKAGPYYLKVVGPATVLEGQKPAFDALLESCRSSEVAEQATALEHP
jgi:hypothetical protein